MPTGGKFPVVPAPFPMFPLVAIFDLDNAIRPAEIQDLSVRQLPNLFLSVPFSSSSAGRFPKLYLPIPNPYTYNFLYWNS